jgi:RNA polymerase sigma factor (sigma-70 family)
MATEAAKTTARSFQSLFDHGTVGGVADGTLVEKFTDGDRGSAEHAFALMVERHGPMVLGVCRALLRGQQDAEDAFQASFLVLARKAGSIRKPDLLPAWLYGVARKAALKARSRRARIGRIEGGSSSMSFDHPDRSPSPEASLSRSDDARLLLEEVSKLREPYRSAIVLCDLEGLSHAEAADRLNCAEGAVSSRVSRGRGLLRQKLLRRGVGSASPLLVVGSTRSILDLALAPNLARAAVQAGVAISNKQSIAGLVSTSAALLSLEVLSAMTWTKIFVAASLAFVAGAAALGVSSAANLKKTIVHEPTRASSLGLDESSEPLSFALARQEPEATPEATLKVADKPAASSSRQSVSTIETPLKSKIARYRRYLKLQQSATISSEEVDSALSEVDMVRAQAAAERDAIAEEETESQFAIELQKLKIELAEIDAEATSEQLALIEKDEGSSVVKTRIIQAKSKAKSDMTQLKIQKLELQSMLRRKASTSQRLKAFEQLLSTYGEPGAPIPENAKKPG